MRRFITKLMIFLAPIVLYFSVPLSLGIFSKEFIYNIDRIVNKSIYKNEKYLVGYAYYDLPYLYLKYKTLKTLPKQKVVALGSSRVLQFRKEMFQSSFYNAGYTISSVKDFMTFLSIIPEANLPEILIIGLDQWMFNENWDNLNLKNKQSYLYLKNPTKVSSELFLNALNIYKDVFRRKIDLRKLFNNNYVFTPIGFNAFINATGIRNDGSYRYRETLLSANINDTEIKIKKFSDTFERIKQGNRRFEYANSVNIAALDELENFLKYCKNKNIHIVGFLPPFPNVVYSAIKKSGNYNYIEKLYKKIAPIFFKNNFEIYSFNSFISCDSQDNEALDGFHGSEPTYLKILIKILEKKSLLNKYCDIDQLRNDLDNAINNYQVYLH